MHLLIPGRHHLLTDFQFKYLLSAIRGRDSIRDLNNNPLPQGSRVESVVFAVTSANHSGTKRNPIPFHLRALMIQEFAKDLPVPCLIYGIDDVGHIEDFASYTLKTISHESDRQLDLSPDNCAVVCSTKVMDMYLRKGFQVLPAELESSAPWRYSQALPWDCVEAIVANELWRQDFHLVCAIHSSTLKIWDAYRLDRKAREILDDPIVGDDGDLTESRDYSSYVRQMDEIAELKYLETAPFIKPGQIGDIGSAVGSWIKNATSDDRLHESDFYGIEAARKLFDISLQRKANGEFSNPNVFFAMKNAVKSLVFRKRSMDTIHTSSLTHEIYSYGSCDDLLEFIANRSLELKPGGIWINRDVVGPQDADQHVCMQVSRTDGRDLDPFLEPLEPFSLHEELNTLCTAGRFAQFASDYQAYKIEWELVRSETDFHVVRLPLRHAAEFMLTKDYVDNWKSEMQESFCHWNILDWTDILKSENFRIHPGSRAYTNPWIRENRWAGRVALFKNDSLESMLPYPPTNMLVVAEKI